MNLNSSYWIKQLNLLPHPEGGFYKETYRCTESIKGKTPEYDRNICTAIYFLLEGKNKSHFHKIKSDELWFFHQGVTLEIFILEKDSTTTLLLGENLSEGEQLQAIIPAGKWFAARVKNQKDFALVSCTVAPGFDFRDFELANKETLLKEFPEQKQIIDEMTISV